MAQRPETIAGVEDLDLDGTNVVVTGGTDGVGRETAISLARLGARVIIHGRAEEKATQVVESVREAGGDIEYHLADFLTESAVHDLADFVLAEMDTVDILVNNAGAHFRKGRLTDAGIERTFAVNHLAPFILTNRLREAIEAAGGRVVTVSSAVHRRTEFEIEAIDSVQGYDGLDAYGQSKFANILFTYALARRLDAATATCLHPGFVPGSGLWRDGGFPIRHVMKLIGSLPDPIQNAIGKTPTVAAATPVYLAAAPEVADTTGRYYTDLEPTESAPDTYDEVLQERLWERSLELVSLDETVY